MAETTETAETPAGTCHRCQNQGPRLPAAPLPSELGEEIRAKTCAACWQEWQEEEVRVINELRLNFMDPEAEVTLQRRMREFLQLDATSPAAESEA